MVPSEAEEAQALAYPVVGLNSVIFEDMEVQVCRAEPLRVRNQLEACCGQDTLGMI